MIPAIVIDLIVVVLLVDVVVVVLFVVLIVASALVAESDAFDEMVEQVVDVVLVLRLTVVVEIERRVDKETVEPGWTDKWYWE